MPAISASKRVENIAVTTKGKLSPMVLKLASKAPYAAPKVISFPVNSTSPADALSFAGNF